ncbi:MAG: hypothetical protein WCL31_04025 [Actinomycetes bacterium]
METPSLLCLTVLTKLDNCSTLAVGVKDGSELEATALRIMYAK